MSHLWPTAAISVFELFHTMKMGLTITPLGPCSARGVYLRGTWGGGSGGGEARFSNVRS